MASRFKMGARFARRYPLPIGAGAAVIGYLQFQRITRKDGHGGGEPFYIPAYKMLPLSAFSRAWGKVNNLELPVWSRSVLLGAYCRAFGCKLDEAKNPDLSSYPNLGTFFRRELREGVRPVDQAKGTLVSPCDGKILVGGRLEGDQDQIDQIKGMTFSLSEFLSMKPKKRNLKEGNAMFYLVIYLAPGDYHGFHSPSNFDVSSRIHFSGLLLSVSPWAARNVSNLFSINERVCYFGKWDSEQFMSLTAVGATNVGCVKVPCDPHLHTNAKDKNSWRKKVSTLSKVFQRGEYFGEFNLGSTIVLVFEAPKTFTFIVNEGDSVKMGQCISG